MMLPDNKHKPEMHHWHIVVREASPLLTLADASHKGQFKLLSKRNSSGLVKTSQIFFICCWLFFVLISKIKVSFIIALNIAFYSNYYSFFVFLYFFVCFRTIVLIALFSQYLSNVKIPLPGYSKNKGGCYVGRYPFFRLFPVSIVADNFQKTWVKNTLAFEGTEVLG